MIEIGTGEDLKIAQAVSRSVDGVNQSVPQNIANGLHIPGPERNNSNSGAVVDIVMPLQEGRCIPQPVLNALAKQQHHELRLWASTLHSKADIASARNYIKSYGLSRFVLMLDNDVALPDVGLSSMVNFLETHGDFGAVAISKRKCIKGQDPIQELPHIDMSCVLFRREVLASIRFRHDSGKCECRCCCDDLRRMGWRIGFLTDLRAEHVLATERKTLVETCIDGC